MMSMCEMGWDLSGKGALPWSYGSISLVIMTLRFMPSPFEMRWIPDIDAMTIHAMR